MEESACRLEFVVHGDSKEMNYSTYGNCRGPESRLEKKGRGGG